MHQFAKDFCIVGTMLISGCGGGQDNACVDDETKQYPIITTRSKIVFDHWNSTFRTEPVSSCFENSSSPFCNELIIEDDERLANLCEFSAIKSNEFNGIAPRRWDALCSMVGKIDWTQKSMVVAYASSRDYYSAPEGDGIGRMATYIFEIIENKFQIEIGYMVQWTVSDQFGLGDLIQGTAGSMHAILIQKPCKPIAFRKIIGPYLTSYYSSSK